MYVTPRPIRPPQNNPLHPRSGSRFMLAFALYALLAMASTLLLAQYGGAALQCGEDPTACGVP